MTYIYIYRQYLYVLVKNMKIGGHRFLYNNLTWTECVVARKITTRDNVIITVRRLQYFLLLLRLNMILFCCVWLCFFPSLFIFKALFVRSNHGCFDAKWKNLLFKTWLLIIALFNCMIVSGKFLGKCKVYAYTWLLVTRSCKKDEVWNVVDQSRKKYVLENLICLKFGFFSF